MGKSAVLLLAHGTPDVLGEMAEYLGKVTGGRALPQEVVEELQHRYAQIGLRETPGVEAPPLMKWTMTQGRLLEQALGGAKVYVGMRNWHPYIADVIAQLRMDGVTHIKAVCLAPQNSRTSVGPGRRCWRPRQASRWSSLLDGRRVRCWRRLLRRGCCRFGQRPVLSRAGGYPFCLPRTACRAGRS